MLTLGVGVGQQLEGPAQAAQAEGVGAAQGAAKELGRGGLVEVGLVQGAAEQHQQRAGAGLLGQRQVVPGHRDRHVGRGQRPAQQRHLPGGRADQDGHVRPGHAVGEVGASGDGEVPVAGTSPVGAVTACVLLTVTDSGCGMDVQGESMQVLRRTLGGYAKHANFAGVLIVGLGCEANQINALLGAESLSEGPLLRTFSIQDTGGTAKAIAGSPESVRKRVC